MADKKPLLSTADILNAVRTTDGNGTIAAERQAARDRLEQGLPYVGPRYCGKTNSYTGSERHTASNSPE
jgi:hypothetical protein